HGDDLGCEGECRDGKNIDLRMPKIQKKCIQTTAEPPAWVSKKWPPRYRSTSNITCAAVSGLMARITMPDMTRLSQANNGIFPKIIPGNAYKESSLGY